MKKIEASHRKQRGRTAPNRARVSETDIEILVTQVEEINKKLDTLIPLLQVANQASFEIKPT